MKNSYLIDTFYLNYNSPEIQNLISDLKVLNSEKEKIEKLYLKVRDDWRYSAFVIGLKDNHYGANTIIYKK